MDLHTTNEKRKCSEKAKINQLYINLEEGWRKGLNYREIISTLIIY